MNPIPPENFFHESRGGITIDVRSPLEFASGHIPGANNIPLFSDDERATIGTIYAKQGRDPAVEKGLEFVGPKMADFVRQARALLSDNPADVIYVHCWRGGMRSQSFAWLLETSGFNVRVLQGGYKSFRKLVHRRIGFRQPMVVLSGLTGAGKTDFLKLLDAAGEQVVDLEGLANHRGSSFGALGLGDQPSTEQFENRLFVALDKLDPERYFWVEDEGSRLGKVVVPSRFVKQIRRSAAVFLDVPKERRINNLMQEYGGLDPDGLIESTRGIQKRLGGQNATDTIKAIETGDIRTAADITLSYYDRSYLKAMAGLPRETSIDICTKELADQQVVQRLIEEGRSLAAAPQSTLPSYD